jgi:hypothetical protein
LQCFIVELNFVNGNEGESAISLQIVGESFRVNEVTLKVGQRASIGPKIALVMVPASVDLNVSSKDSSKLFDERRLKIYAELLQLKLTSISKIGQVLIQLGLDIIDEDPVRRTLLIRKKCEEGWVGFAFDDGHERVNLVERFGSLIKGAISRPALSSGKQLETVV